MSFEVFLVPWILKDNDWIVFGCGFEHIFTNVNRNLFIGYNAVLTAMKVVLANITVSTGGVLRLSKDLMNQMGIQPGDKIVVMREDDSVTIQFQRNGDILLRLADAKIVKS